MTTVSTWQVTGMTCAHCTAAVRAEVGRVDGVQDVEVALETGEVTVTSDGPVAREQVAAAVEEAGYHLA